jgi:hypothetical protein
LTKWTITAAAHTIAVYVGFAHLFYKSVHELKSSLIDRDSKSELIAPNIIDHGIQLSLVSSFNTAIPSNTIDQLENLAIMGPSLHTSNAGSFALINSTIFTF